MPTTAKKKKSTKKKPASKKALSAQFFAAASSRIEDEVAQYMWSSFGPHAYFVDVRLPLSLGSAQIIIDLVTHRVYEMTACDYREWPNKQAWRWVNPLVAKKLKAESQQRGVDYREAWDKIQWVDVSSAKVLERVRKLVRAARKFEKSVPRK